METANTTPIECSHACSRWTDRVSVSRVHSSISAGGLAVRSDTDASGSLVLAHSTRSVAPLSHTFATCGRISPLCANLHARAPSSCLSHYPVKLQRRSCARSGGLGRLTSAAGRSGNRVRNGTCRTRRTPFQAVPDASPAPAASRRTCPCRNALGAPSHVRPGSPRTSSPRRLRPCESRWAQAT